MLQENADFLAQLIRRYEVSMFVVNRRMNALLRERMSELTLDQYSTLQYIRANNVCTSSELADIFCVGKSSITAIVTRLVDKRLIRREQDAKDRRVTYLYLTAEGEQIVDRMEEKIREQLGLLIKHFDKQEAEQFIGTFEKLAGLLMHSDEKEIGNE